MTRAAALTRDLSDSDRRAVGWWLWSRVGTVLVVTISGSLLGSATEAPRFLDNWRHWDVVHYESIARDGYVVGGPTPFAAFFPGLPSLVRLVSTFGPSLTLAGLIVSFVAGLCAVTALSRLAALEGPAASGDRAVLLMLVSPAAVFLAAGYSEALFLGFALPAWLAARQGRWWTAGLLAAGASTVRVTGIFLAIALVVEWLTTERRRDPQHAMALTVPFLPVLAYMAFLKAVYGNWLEWIAAQKQGWHRDFTDPITAWHNTWEAAFGTSQPLAFRVMFQAEIVALLVGVALTLWLMWQGRWGETTYIGLQVIAFGTSTWFFSVPRATLLWWPLWLLLGRVTLRRPWTLAAYLSLIAPLAVLWAAAFATNRWAG